ncbi:FAD-dependent oxidoreductase [Actinoallomurus sp. CA-142502]|uniref:FAD-dependent oxidoreductase n=1 Tax=Actinoallomurus sp. CA-142502 TaxID=3239885 RepID=UPI003D8A62F4
MSTDAEVVVVGAGAAGMTAALRAARGGRVIVFEKSTRHGCNTQYSSGSLAAGGTRLQAEAGIEDSPERHARDILAASGDPGAAALVRAVCAAAPRYVDWLVDELDHPLELGIDMPRAGQSVPRLHTDPGRGGGKVLVQTLRRAMSAVADITFVDETPVIGLRYDGARVTGVRVREHTGEQEVTADEVVLACDGYGNNPDLLRRFTPDAATAFHGGVSTSRGDAVIWGERIGAGLRNMGAYLGHGQVVAGHGTRLNPNLPFLGALMVDGAGRRFCDEKAQGYSRLGGLIRRLPGERAVMIWDEPAHEVARHSELMRESIAAGAFRRYADLSSLAGGLGLPEDTLGRTLDGFVAASDLVKRPVERLRPPWYAAWITHGILTTQGGLLIDAEGHVLRPDGTPIPGLSAAGGAATGISGPSPDGYSSGNGLLAAMGMGWIVGNRLGSAD